MRVNIDQLTDQLRRADQSPPRLDSSDVVERYLESFGLLYEEESVRSDIEFIVAAYLHLGTMYSLPFAVSD
jgi:hypothetical protein